MTNVDELIEALTRACGNGTNVFTTISKYTLKQSADALKLLQSYISKTKSIVEKYEIEVVPMANAIIETLQAENKSLRNELCYKCGQYREAHNGACNGCKWREKGVE